MSNKQTLNKLSSWIEETVYEKWEEEACVALSCVHKEGNAENEVYAVKLANLKIEPDSLAQTFYDRASDHVNDMAGSQLFFLYALFGNARHPQKRLGFRIEVQIDYGYGGTEPPNGVGITQQQMRQGETAYMFWARMVGMLITTQQNQIQQLMNFNQNLMREQHDVVELGSKVILERSAQMNENKLKDFEMQKAIEFYKMAGRLGPGIVNAIAGTEVIPQSAEDSGIVEMLLDKLSVDELKVIATKNPELAAVLANRLEKRLTEKKEVEKSVEQIAKKSLELNGTSSALKELE